MFSMVTNFLSGSAQLFMGSTVSDEKTLVTAPLWIRDIVTEKKMETIQLPGNRMVLSQLDQLELKGSMAFVSAGPTHGIYMRLKVRHIMVDDSVKFDRMDERYGHRDSETLPKSDEYFFMTACAYNHYRSKTPGGLDEEWLLSSHGDDIRLLSKLAF